MPFEVRVLSCLRQFFLLGLRDDDGFFGEPFEGSLRDGSSVGGSRLTSPDPSDEGSETTALLIFPKKSRPPGRWSEFVILI